MCAEFRRKKFVQLFKFFDTDQSDFIEKKDFEQFAKLTSEARGWSQESDKYKNTEATILKIWDILQKQADKDNDGKVSLEEWIGMCEQFANNPSSPLEWQSLYCKFIFDLEDASGDGAIDAEELSSVMESFGNDKSSTVAVFEKMAKGKSSVTWPEFQELWKEFFVSDDPDAPGNYVFGELLF